MRKHIGKIVAILLLAFGYYTYSSGTLLSTSENEDRASLAYNGWEKTVFSNKDKPRNPEKAFRHYMVAAKRGSAKSQNMIGAMYANGDGVKQSYTEAAYWWNMAAEQDNDWALNNMGTLYLNGNGVPKDEEKALEYFKKSAALGNKEAQKTLAIINDDTDIISDMIFDEMKVRSKRHKLEEEQLRKSGYYKKLETINQEGGSKALGQEIVAQLKTVKKARVIKTINLYMDDKLDDQDVSDPEYLMLGGLISSIYTTLIKEEAIKTHDVFAYQDSHSKEVSRYYQWLLISLEDQARCSFAQGTKAEKLQVANEKFSKKYSAYLKKGNAEVIKAKVLALSNKIKDREPNPKLCGSSESNKTNFITDDDWLKKREEIREKFSKNVLFTP